MYVSQRQRNLKMIGWYYKGSIDGIQGSQTIQAIKDFQKDMKITVDGIWGSETENKAISYCKSVQAKLNNKISAGLVEDGIAGDATEAAIKKFQKLNNLDVDGIAGKDTLNKLNESTPTQNGKKIMLDPGHGGSDPGAVGNGFKEKDLNLSIAKHCKAYLESKGYQVAMTRDNDNYISLMDRCYKENDYKPVVFVSIHNNAGGGDGSEFIYISDKGLSLAKCIKPCIDELGQNFRRYIKRDDAVVTYTVAPSVIVECAFIDNSTDIQFVNTEEKRKKVGEAIAKGIIKYVG